MSKGIIIPETQAELAAILRRVASVAKAIRATDALDFIEANQPSVEGPGAVVLDMATVAGHLAADAYGWREVCVIEHAFRSGEHVVHSPSPFAAVELQKLTSRLRCSTRPWCMLVTEEGLRAIEAGMATWQPTALCKDILAGLTVDGVKWANRAAVALAA